MERSVDSAVSRSCEVALESMLVAPMLRPLAGDLDALGEYGLDLLATKFAALLERAR